MARIKKTESQTAFYYSIMKRNDLPMRLNKQTLSEQIYDILRQDILTQKITCGTKLTLKMLQERFEVSSTPIREALTRLSEEGLMFYYSNIGVRVLEFTPQDLREIFQFMGDLDALAVQYAAENPQCEELANRLRENLAACEKETDMKRLLELSDEFHLLFYEYCDNSRLKSSAERMRSQLSVAAYQYEQQADNRSHIHEEHKEIYDAFNRGETNEAAAKMKAHLMHSLTYAQSVWAQKINNQN